MPRRELSCGSQVENWLIELGPLISSPSEMILIGSGALLWHAAQQGITEPLPENSMDVDPVTDSEEVARFCYEALIGSEFERTHGWHVNLMPDSVLKQLPAGWIDRSSRKSYGSLAVVVPSPADLIVPKLKRNEPRDRMHVEWARRVGILNP
jgi:hypothetical protein